VNRAPQESVPPGTRRQFSASEKLRLVQSADAALATGERGAVEALDAHRRGRLIEFTRPLSQAR
jgi:hypothetical protein